MQGGGSELVTKDYDLCREGKGDIVKITPRREPGATRYKCGNTSERSKQRTFEKRDGGVQRRIPLLRRGSGDWRL